MLHSPPSLRSLSITLLCLGAWACGGSPEPVGPSASRDLLERGPDRLVETPAQLRPAGAATWSQPGHAGWRAPQAATAERPAAVVAKSVAARLGLPAADQADRELELLAWLPPGVGGPDAAAEVELRLNGVSLGSLGLTAEPTRGHILAPASAWVRGANELVLAMAPTELLRAPDGELVGLALAELDYGRPARVELEDGRPRLAPGTGLRYRVEERGAARLSLDATPTGPGRLELRLRPLSQVTTSLLDGARLVGALETDGAPLTGAWTLPAAEGALLELELAWESDDATLGLERLVLDEALERPSPPIVLISIDTLAARHLSLYGYPRATSPRLDAFAEDAVVFDACSTNAPWTMPSYAALMSGYFPSSARTSPNLTDTHFARTLPDNRWTLAEALEAAGYRTGAFVDSPNVRARLGFDQGFEHFDESALDVPHGEPGGGLRTAMAAALAWLDDLERRAPESPYLLFLHANDVHGPYRPEEEQLGAFRADDHAAPGRELFAGALSGTFSQVPGHLLGSALGEFDPEAERLPATPFVDAYDESILSLDSMLGELFAELEARGVLDEAVVVFTADHGEAFDEHDFFGHGQLYEEVLHVPLLVRLPPALRAETQPARVPLPVQLVDLYPTLAQLAGLAAPRPDLHGRSLVPLLEGHELPAVPIFAEGGVMRQSAVVLDGWKLLERWPNQGTVPWAMLTNPVLPEGWREQHTPELLEGPLTEQRLALLGERVTDLEALFLDLSAQLEGRHLELYDLGQDPRELEDLFQARPDKVAELLPHLAAAQARLEQTRELDAEGSVQLTAEDLAELEALGY